MSSAGPGPSVPAGTACGRCYVGQCKRHPMQDHGRREQALLNSKAEYQKKLYASLIQPKLAQMMQQQKANSAAENDKYREEVGKHREKAQRRKSKYTADQAAKMMIQNDSADEEDSKRKRVKSSKKRKKRESESKSERKERRKEKKRRRKEQKEMERRKRKARERRAEKAATASSMSSSSSSNSSSSSSSEDSADEEKAHRKRKRRRMEAKESGSETASVVERAERTACEALESSGLAEAARTLDTLQGKA